MSNFHDPLSFGEAGDDVECIMDNMEDLNLDRGSGPSTGGYDSPHGRVGSDAQPSNPFFADTKPTGNAFASYGQLVEPKSYDKSDSFAGLDANLGVDGGAEGTPMSPTFDPPSAGPPPEQLLHISVSDPQTREQANMIGVKSSYVVYRVTTRTNLPAYSSAETSVQRRFREFVDLSEVLRNKFRGYIIPPRPDKNVLDAQRKTDTFLEERRVALERYLNRLARHPVVARSEELRLFLDSKDDLSSNYQWQSLLPQAGNFIEGTAKLSKQLVGKEQSVLDPVEAAQPTRKAGDIMRAVKESMQNMRVQTLTDDEIELRKHKQHFDDMKLALMEASRTATNMINRLDKVGAVYGDLGLSLLKLSQFEEQDGLPLAQLTSTMRFSSSFSSDCKKAAQCLVRLCRLGRKVTGRCAVELSPIHETLSFMPAALRAFHSREHQLLTQQTLEAELEAKQKQLYELETTNVRVFGGDRARITRVASLKGDTSKLDLSIMAAKTEYDKIKNANYSEIERFNKEMRVDMLAMLQGLARVQVAAAERSLESWLQVAQELGTPADQVAAIKLGTASLPSSNGAATTSV